MSTLAELRDRIEEMLMDTGNAIWTADVIDEGIHQALDQYSAANPLMMETVITLPGTGREIALNNLTGLIKVLDLWWPYDTGASVERWPPNKVRGYRLWWDDNQPVLFLELVPGGQPQIGDEVRIWYSKGQTIQNLDSAASTTVQGDHESVVILGAAGHAAMSRTADLIETANTDLYQVGLLGTWGQRKIREFHSMLKVIRQAGARSGPAWRTGWALDKWDEGKTQYG